MALKSVLLVIYNGLVYIPTYGVNQYNSRVIVEPIYKVGISEEEIYNCASKIIFSEPILLPYKTREEYRPLVNLLPNATGTKSWKRLCSSAFAYSIYIVESTYFVEKTSLDEKGRWIYLIENRKSYPIETDFYQIIHDVILDISKTNHTEES